MYEMFWLSTSFNSDVSQWDTSSVTAMFYMFGYATSFNGDVSQWDTLSVTTMSYMFNSATSFNGDISQWDTSSVTTTAYMFYSASSFDQDLCWDVSSVTTTDMFSGSSGSVQCSIFDDSTLSGAVDEWLSDSTTTEAKYGHISTGDTSQWDTSRVTSMKKMFNSATFFNHDVSQWDT